MLNQYQVAVVGGGPAGMMAAAKAADCGAKVVLLEKNPRLGKKMLITGGGRCNLTNIAGIDEMVSNIPGNGRFVYSSLHRFSGEDLRAFFGKLGIQTKIEDQGRVFPVSNSAGEVVDALERYLRQQGVGIQLEIAVDNLLVENKRCRGLVAGGRVIKTMAVVVATGGLSFPGTGSTGEGHRMARRIGHQVTPFFPAAVAITCTDPWITGREVQGISLEKVRITVYNSGGKKLASEMGDVILTHWGFSGPGALRVGRAVALEKQREPGAPMKGELDLFTMHTTGELAEKLQELAESGSKKSLKNCLAALLPERLVKVLLELAYISPEIPVARLIKGQRDAMVSLMKAVPVTIQGTRPLAEATVTGGGIHVKEVYPKSMESKLIKGLFFAGEILDVDAHTGGFNMQVAFSTGYVAGEAAAALARETLDELDYGGVNYD